MNHQNPGPPIPDRMSFRGSRSQIPQHLQSTLNFSTIQDPDGKNEELCVELAERESKLQEKSISELKVMCKERCEKVSGSKHDLIIRLMCPRKPEVLITRSRRKQYIPLVPSCNAALLVALLLHHENNPSNSGMLKEDLMVDADETGVSKEPMAGNGTSFYDGWSGMNTALCQGDPPLVYKEKKKYRLTSQPPGNSGIDVARAIHILAHRQNICRCGKYIHDPLANT